MKFVVTFVRLSQYSRRRVGKASTQIIDTTATGSVFSGLDSPHAVEAAFEKLYATDQSVTAKVVDVRLVTEEVVQHG